MAAILSLARGANAINGVAGRAMHFTVSVSNTSVADVTLTSLVVSSDNCLVDGPVFMEAGVLPGNPTILAAATAVYGFDAVFTSPYNPGGTLGATANSQRTLLVEAQFSDGSVGRASLTLVLKSVVPLPPKSGGCFQQALGTNAVNYLVSLL